MLGKVNTSTSRAFPAVVSRMDGIIAHYGVYLIISYHQL